MTDKFKQLRAARRQLEEAVATSEAQIKAQAQVQAQAKAQAKAGGEAEADSLPPDPEPGWFGETAEMARARAEEDRRWDDKQKARATRFGGLAPLDPEPLPDTGWRQARLGIEGVPARPAEPQGGAEAEMSALMAELRVLMRDVCVQSARLCVSVEERLRFIDSACRVADTGARLGESLAKMHLPGGTTESHKRVTFDFVHRAPASRMEADGAEAPLP